MEKFLMIKNTYIINIKEYLIEIKFKEFIPFLDK